MLAIGLGYAITALLLLGAQSPVAVAERLTADDRKEVRIQVIAKSSAAAEMAPISTPDEAATPSPVFVAVAAPGVIAEKLTGGAVFEVPFYSQFADISSASWQKVGCGIASLAMLIDFYADGVESVDSLLNRGIASGSFLSDAGWIHAGLIGLSKKYGLDGGSYSLAGESSDEAFAQLESVLKEGPVMASVHYTFEPTNPIPHLVVVRGVRDGLVFYNDPAEPAGGGSLSIEKFKRAWKQRYIAIRPTI